MRADRSPRGQRPPGPDDVVLREVAEADLPVFFEHQRDPDATRMAAFPARDRDAFLAHWTRILSDPGCVTRTILVGGEVAGNIGSWEDSGERLVGYWIGQRYWGRGVASRALAEFLRLLPARPLYARVAKHNRASLRVLEKCGFAVVDEDTVPAGTGATDTVEEFILRLDPAAEARE